MQPIPRVRSLKRPKMKPIQACQSSSSQGPECHGQPSTGLSRSSLTSVCGNVASFTYPMRTSLACGSSSYEGGVRIGLVERDDMDRFEQVRHSQSRYLASLSRASICRHPTSTNRSSAATTVSLLPHPTHGTARTGRSQSSSTSKTRGSCSSRTA